MKTTCGVFIFDKTGLLLVGHPSGHAYTGNVWSIPKGEQDPGETAIETAARETLEEANLDIDPDYLQHVGSAVYPTGKKTLIAFFVQLTGDCTEYDVKCTSRFKNHKDEMILEIDHFKWVDPILAPELLHSAQVELLPKALEFLSDE